MIKLVLELHPRHPISEHRRGLLHAFLRNFAAKNKKSISNGRLWTLTEYIKTEIKKVCIVILDFNKAVSKRRPIGTLALITHALIPRLLRLRSSCFAFSERWEVIFEKDTQSFSLMPRRETRRGFF